MTSEPNNLWNRIRDETNPDLPTPEKLAAQDIPAVDSELFDQSPHVLLVDDQPFVAEVIRQQLTSEHDILFMHCDDASRAVETAATFQATVILQDLVMPGVDGLEMLASYRRDERTREIPIIVLSGRDQPAIKARAFESGANDYLVKSPDRVELVARIRYHSQSYNNLIQRREAFKALHLYSQRLEEEKRRSERLLLNILPQEIARRLELGEHTIADYHPEASVMFADIVNFTPAAARLSATELVEMLNKVFTAFDERTHRYGLEKVKTIGDAYMVVGGIPRPDPHHLACMADMALDLLALVDEFRWSIDPTFNIRIGFHVGPVVAGVIGKRKFSYDLWGDTVNLASRLESHGLPGRIQVADSTKQKLEGLYRFEARGVMNLKGMAPIDTWFLLGQRTG